MSTQDKSALRDRALANRAAMAPLHADAPGRVAGHVLSELTAHTGDIAAVYVAMHNELDPLPLVEGLSARGVVIALPCVTGARKPLVFRRWVPGDPLVPAGFGTREPAPDAAEVTPNVMFVPLLAYDATGVRLGYGGGFYDRTLTALRAKNPGFRAIGLAYRFQRLDRLPRDAHDHPLDAVVTEAGFEWFDGPREMR